METETANVLFGFPQYDLVPTKDGTAMYREIRFTHPADQRLFNCEHWTPPQGMKSPWRTKYSSSQLDRPGFHSRNTRGEEDPPSSFSGDSSDSDSDRSAPEVSEANRMDVALFPSSGTEGRARGHTNPGWEEKDDERSNIDSVLVHYDEAAKCWSGVVSFPTSLIGLLFGKGMRNLQQLQATTNTRIVVTPADGDKMAEGNLMAGQTSVCITSSVSRESVDRGIMKVLRIADTPIRPQQQERRIFQHRQQQRVEELDSSEPSASSGQKPSHWMTVNKRLMALSAQQQQQQHKQLMSPQQHRMMQTDLLAVGLTHSSQSVPQRRWTHFCNLPIHDELFRSQFNHFKAQVLRESHSYHVESEMFSLPSRLHLTLFLLNLNTSEKLERCRSVFEQSQAAVYDAVGSRTVLLDFKGIDIMNDDSSRAAVVYTAPVNTDKCVSSINRLTDVLIKNLMDASLISRSELHEQRCLASDGVGMNLKLHATLINARHGQSNRIDASRLVRDFKFLSFAKKVTFQTVHLSSLSEFDKNGYYSLLAQCRLP